MHGFQFDERAKFWSKCFLSDQIDSATEEILEEELDAEVSVRGRRPIEGDENIDITVRPRGVAGR